MTIQIRSEWEGAPEVNNALEYRFLASLRTLLAMADGVQTPLALLEILDQLVKSRTDGAGHEFRVTEKEGTLEGGTESTRRAEAIRRDSVTETATLDALRGDLQREGASSTISHQSLRKLRQWMEMNVRLKGMKNQQASHGIMPALQKSDKGRDLFPHFRQIEPPAGNG